MVDRRKADRLRDMGERHGIPATRWIQLALGVACSVAIANLQYGWTLFIDPIHRAHGWSLAAIQWTFTIAITVETFIGTPFSGRYVDRIGPRLGAIAGPLIAAAWLVNAHADQLWMFYCAAVLSGLGTGLVFACTNGNAQRWFPDRRGLAAGLSAAGFAGGGALITIPLGSMIQASGYQSAYLWFGIGQGLVVLAAASFLRAPTAAEASAMPPARLPQRDGHLPPREMVRTVPFWLMYAMFVMVATGGLMTAAQLAPLATAYGVAQAPVAVLGTPVPALRLALVFGLLMNALSRPLFGWVSDHIGRERAMFTTFAIEAAALLGLVLHGHDPVAFVLFTGLVFFAWGQIFSLFPAICADTYGNRFASTNFGILATAKGLASWFVPVASLITVATGSWTAAFAFAALLNAGAALLVFALHPARKRLMAAATPAG